MREARRDPEAANAACKQAGAKGYRMEVRIARLVAGPRTDKQDQTPRWASAAAYVAYPPNGDPPPQTWKDAVRYIAPRGGERRLADLYGNHHRDHDDTDDCAFVARDVAAYNSRPGLEDRHEWYTPVAIFRALGWPQFDCDPASPGAGVLPHIPGIHYTIEDDGLTRPWCGFCWLNPPFGRNPMPQWAAKFAAHRNGIMLVPERTSAKYYQDLVVGADLRPDDA